MRFLFVLLISIGFIFAKSDKMSQIVPANNVIINLEEIECDINCLKQFLDEGKIFSFLAFYNENYNEVFGNEYTYLRGVFRLGLRSDTLVRVALLIPQKSIRKYAITTVNTTLAYLMNKQNSFELKVYNTIHEDSDSIKTQMDEIKRDGFIYVIAPVTNRGVKFVIENADGLLVYIPTIHKGRVINSDSKNIFFGGIDYKKQIDELLKYANNRVAYFGDGSELSNYLNKIVEEKTPKIVYKKIFKSSKINFKRVFRRNKKLQNSSIFLNTPLVKSSLIASQLRYYSIRPYALLSTQINYNPMLLSLTQFPDRKDLYLANSIGRSEVSLQEYNSLLGHDITYDWVNYSTAVGMDYFYTNYIDSNSLSLFGKNLFNNQVEYDVSIIQPKRYKFESVSF